MKLEFTIDLSKDANSSLEALHTLSMFDPSKGFHISYDLRPRLEYTTHQFLEYAINSQNAVVNLNPTLMPR